MSIKIITDTGCDLSKEIIDEYDIEVMPFIVNLDEQEYEDGVNIKPETVYNSMRNGKVPKTAQISAGKLKEVFEKYAQEGETCIYIAFSSELSGTYQTAVMVKNELLNTYPDFDLTIIDTKCASMGHGLVVYRAAQMAKEGKTKDEVLDTIEYYKNHMEHIFTVDNLEYLYRGGRVSRTAAFVGELLKIKPVLHVEDGKLIPIEKVRGRKKVFKKILKIMEERGDNLENQTIAITHGDDIKGATKIKEMIAEKFGCKDFIINMIGSAIGAHSGPGTIAIFFLNKYNGR
ncbi:DegV family protein [Thermohalobacter berrensis]|uniref:Fatty acid-binding protein DegV n=1 Tax=Thermohalobacter berrensis TaxID=99594 RepID=A0A419T6B5_9FIRM|nr:DegV family protein [Thermohalobacter berrensis]RKD32966.1 fatty acid-binding protein DegV [Thermohalobacter berrensis]